MHHARQIQKFRTDGKTASPERLIVLLYERLGRDLDEARAAIEAGDAERRHTALLHAQEIIEELSYAVNTDIWPEGEGLIALYDYLLDLLVRANIQADLAPIAEASKTVNDLADAWRAAYVELATTSTANDPAASAV